MTIADHWARAIGVLTAAISSVERIKTLQAAAARQLDSADYALTQLIEDLRPGDGAAGGCLGAARGAGRGRAQDAGARAPGAGGVSAAASKGADQRRVGSPAAEIFVASKLVGAASITEPPNFCTSSTASPRSLSPLALKRTMPSTPEKPFGLVKLACV